MGKYDKTPEDHRQAILDATEAYIEAEVESRIKTYHISVFDKDGAHVDVTDAKYYDGEICLTI